MIGELKFNVALREEVIKKLEEKLAKVNEIVTWLMLEIPHPDPPIAEWKDTAVSHQEVYAKLKELSS